MADRRGDYWIAKSLINKREERATVTDALIGAVAPLIDAPTCDTAILWYPDDEEPLIVETGVQLEPGTYFHGSKRLIQKQVIKPERQVKYGQRDDNARRWIGLAALYDWCWGQDPQWLFHTEDDTRLYSHDHGWYLPGPNGTWSSQGLKDKVDQPHSLLDDVYSAPDVELLHAILIENPHYCSEYANSLREITADQLAASLTSIPESWPVSDHELADLGWFLYRRAAPVAQRLENFGSVGGVQ